MIDFCFCSVTPAGLYSSIHVDAGRATRGFADPCRLLMMTEAKPIPVPYSS